MPISECWDYSVLKIFALSIRRLFLLEPCDLRLLYGKEAHPLCRPTAWQDISVAEASCTSRTACHLDPLAVPLSLGFLFSLCKDIAGLCVPLFSHQAYFPIDCTYNCIPIVLGKSSNAVAKLKVYAVELPAQLWENMYSIKICCNAGLS